MRKWIDLVESSDLFAGKDEVDGEVRLPGIAHAEIQAKRGDYVVIHTWSGDGTGRSREALRILKEFGKWVVVNDPGDEGTASRSYWDKMYRERLVDALIDEDGNRIKSRKRPVTESVDPARLEAIARDLIDINSDVLPDGMIEEFTGSEADCLAVIERCYHSADCDYFADVCQELTGDQPYTIRCGHAHHTVLSLNDFDGPFYDITGMVTLAEIINRYGFMEKHTEVLEGAMDGLEQDDDFHRPMIVDVIRYLKLIGRKPFSGFSV